MHEFAGQSRADESAKRADAQAGEAAAPMSGPDLTENCADGRSGSAEDEDLSGGGFQDGIEPGVHLFARFFGGVCGGDPEGRLPRFRDDPHHLERQPSDEGISGRTSDRPALNDVVKAMRRGQVDVVAVWRFDRLARSLSHLVKFLEECRTLGVAFVSHQEGIDTRTPIGMAMFQVAGAMAELEANLARERVQAGLDAARARGVVVGRPRHELDHATALAAVQAHGSVRKAATALGVAPTLVARRLKVGPRPIE